MCLPTELQPIERFLGPPIPNTEALRLLAVGSAWFALWLVYLLFVIRYFQRIQTARKEL